MACIETVALQLVCRKADRPVSKGAAAQHSVMLIIRPPASIQNHQQQWVFFLPDISNVADRGNQSYQIVFSLIYF